MFLKITHFTKKQCLQNQQNQKLGPEIIENFSFTINKIFRKKNKKTFSVTDGNNENFLAKIFHQITKNFLIFFEILQKFGHNKAFLIFSEDFGYRGEPLIF